MSSVSGMSLHMPLDHTLRGHRRWHWTSHNQLHKQECKITVTWAPLGVLEDSCWRVTLPTPSYHCCLLSQRAGKGLEAYSAWFPMSTKHRWEREDGTKTKAQRDSCSIYRRKTINFLSSFPSRFPRHLNPHPHRLSPRWYGRKCPWEARWALILQPQVTHFPKELRECRAGGARALEQIVGFNRQIGHCYRVCCLEFPPLYYN